MERYQWIEKLPPEIEVAFFNVKGEFVRGNKMFSKGFFVEDFFKERSLFPWEGKLYEIYVKREEEGTLAFAKDVTEVISLKEEKHWMKEILDHINEGVIATDVKGRITMYNRKLGEFENLNPENVLGCNLKEIYQWETETSEHMQVMESGAPIKERSYTTITRLGKTNEFVASTRPIRWDNKIVGAYSISRNVNGLREIYERAMTIQDRKGLKQRETKFTLEDIVCNNSVMKKLLRDSKKAAESKLAVLVCGETGTGKEMLVQGIHNAGAYSKEPFVALNCAALPENLLESLLFGTVKGAFTGAENTQGFFQKAGKGTLYLDEINSMAISLQAKLLRVLEDRTYHKVGGTKEEKLLCKVISSVNKDPQNCVKEGRLREDLYYRLNGITLDIPPLRERMEDFPLLIQFFLKKYADLYGKGKITLSEHLNQGFLNYQWPGNVRELEHIIEQGISLLDGGDQLDLYSMPLYLREKLSTGNRRKEKKTTLKEVLRAAEKKEVEAALKKAGGNITKGAELLGIGRQNMQYRMRKLGIEKRNL